MREREEDTKVRQQTPLSLMNDQVIDFRDNNNSVVVHYNRSVLNISNNNSSISRISH